MSQCTNFSAAEIIAACFTGVQRMLLQRSKCSSQARLPVCCCSSPSRLDMAAKSTLTWAGRLVVGHVVSTWTHSCIITNEAWRLAVSPTVPDQFGRLQQLLFGRGQETRGFQDDQDRRHLKNEEMFPRC